MKNRKPSEPADCHCRKTRNWENSRLKTILAFLDRGTVRTPLSFLHGRIYKDYTSLLARGHSLSCWSGLLDHHGMHAATLLFFARRSPGSPCCDAKHCGRAYPLMLRSLMLVWETLLILNPFFSPKRRTNSSSQPSSPALASSADRSWLPTDKPRPRRNTSVRKPKQPALAPRAALL